MVNHLNIPATKNWDDRHHSRKCIEQHGVKYLYSKFIGNGDSSVRYALVIGALQLRRLSVPIMLSSVFTHILRHLYMTIHATEEGEN